MTIGRNSRKSLVRSSIRAPKFLDKSSGFYGRLDEPETTTEEGDIRGNGVEDGGMNSPSVTVVHKSGPEEDVEGLDFTDGTMEDDGETLLRRKPSRRSSRWRRSSRRKQREAKEEQTRDERPGLGTQCPADAPDLEDKLEVELEKLRKMEEDGGDAGVAEEPPLVHFQVQEFADDRVLIRDKKRGREEEGEEERKIKKEQEEGMKVVKRKSYRKAFDRALRRGWEAFVTNLYSVTLTPVSPSSSSSAASPSLKKQHHRHTAVLAEFR
ncbi:uncharacterized protein sb:cb1058 [Kryptolebias marmoratus]|uniref:uncharacterized protein sb:cb1058 n=1 Tax=Kryptolebias marmoratus TaxID=37003 RepID=UPI0007F9398B|nr:uncharacterized protein sb:cb1058 [Kryptolebias marmoratus]